MNTILAPCSHWRCPVWQTPPHVRTERRSGPNQPGGATGGAWGSGWNASLEGSQNYCAILNEGNASWNTTSCLNQNDFICKISKGNNIFSSRILSAYKFSPPFSPPYPPNIFRKIS